MIATIKNKRRKVSAIFGQPTVPETFTVPAANISSSPAKSGENESRMSLTAKLSAMIARGASFDVGPDGFQFFGVSERENIFLRDNNAAVLCTLHQSALMKYLSLSDLQMFKDEVRERATILSDGETKEPPFEVVAEVAREWFIDLLEEITKK